MRTLRQGATGRDVKVLQSLLQSLGYNPGTIDGIYGPKTSSSVIQFQQSNGLISDGIVGPQTWNSLKSSSIAELRNY